MQASNWIERASDGRAYYVRKKSSNRFSGPPATTVSSSSQQPTDTPQPAQDNTGNRASTPRAKSNTRKPRATTPQVPPSMAENKNTASGPPYSQPQSQNPQYPTQYPMYPSYPPYSAFPQPNTFGENHPRQEYHTQQPDHGALTHYAAPHPRMYPYIPPGSHPMALPPMPPQSGPTGQMPQGGPPAGYYTPQPGMSNFPPMGPAHVSMTGIPPSQDPQKPKCSECGRTRSSRYRWKHRPKPGQPTRPNICRRCRKTATDSDDEGTNSEDEKLRRHRSQSRHRSRGRTSRPRSRARSSSRPTHRIDFDYRGFQASNRSSSDSDGSGYDRPDTRKGGRRRQNSRSSSGEVVRYRDAPIHRSRSRSKKVVYVEASRDQIEFSDSEGDVEVRYVNHRASGPVIVSRPPTPAARPQPNQSSNHLFRAPIVIEHREYYHEPEPISQLTRNASFSGFGSRKHYRQDRSMAARDEEYDIEPYGPREEEHFYEIGTDGSSRGPMSRRHVRRRSRSRVSIDEGAESRLRDPLIHHAPSPPPLRRRSSSVKIVTDRGRESSGEDHERVESRFRAPSHGRRRSEAEGRRYRRDSAPVDDYDWYDKDGMKVRVREI